MTTYYVSNTSANGIGVGNDQTGTGSESSPFLTLVKALAVAQAGDTIVLNNGIYSPAGGTFDITNGVTIDSLVSGQATITGTGGEAPLTVEIANGGTLTLGAVVIDGQEAAANDIALASESTTFTLNLAETILRNATGYAIAGTENNTQVNLDATGVTYTAGLSQGMVGLASLAQGNIVIHGGSINISDQTGLAANSNSGDPDSATIGVIDATGTNVTASVTGVTAVGNLNGASTVGTGLTILNVANAHVESNTITLSGAANTAFDVFVTYDLLNPLNASGATIENNTLYNFNSSGGVLIKVGEDADPGQSLWGYADNATVSGNIGIGDTASQAADLHGILVGWQAGAIVSGNFMEETELAYVMKGDYGTNIVSGNLDMDTGGKSWYQKGGSGVDFTDNASYQETGYRPVGYYIGPDDEESGAMLPASGGVASGNTVWYAGTGYSGHFVYVADGSAVQSISDDYYYSAGPLDDAAWYWEGTFYKTLASWQASHESTASWTTSGDTFTQFISQLSESGGFIIAPMATVAPVTVSGTGTKDVVTQDLVYAGGLNEGAGAIVSIAAGDALIVTDTTSISGSIIGDGSLSLTDGSMTIETGAKVTVAEWWISGGNTGVTVEHVLDYSGAFSAIAGAVLTLTDANLVLRSSADLSDIAAEGSGRLYTEGNSSIDDVTIDGTAWLDNSGVATENGGNLTLGDSSGAAAALYNASGGTYDITDDSGIGIGTSTASRIYNVGVFEKTSGTGTSVVLTDVSNNGSVIAQSGTLDFHDAVSGTGIDIVWGAATLEFDDSVGKDQTIGFVGQYGELVLDHPHLFVGEVTDFGATDTIEVAKPFAYVGFVENAAGAKGTLEFADGHIDANVVLVGQYVASEFTVEHGPAGSTLITCTPPADLSSDLLLG